MFEWKAEITSYYNLTILLSNLDNQGYEIISVSPFYKSGEYILQYSVVAKRKKNEIK